MCLIIRVYGFRKTVVAVDIAAVADDGCSGGKGGRDVQGRLPLELGFIRTGKVKNTP